VDRLIVQQSIPPPKSKETKKIESNNPRPPPLKAQLVPTKPEPVVVVASTALDVVIVHNHRILLRVPENALPTRSINVSVAGQDQRAAILRRAVSALLVFEVSGGGFGAADLGIISMRRVKRMKEDLVNTMMRYSSPGTSSSLGLLQQAPEETIT
jgi:hypothetical protein